MHDIKVHRIHPWYSTHIGLCSYLGMLLGYSHVKSISTSVSGVCDHLSLASDQFLGTEIIPMKCVLNTTLFSSTNLHQLATFGDLFEACKGKNQSVKCSTVIFTFQFPTQAELHIGLNFDRIPVPLIFFCIWLMVLALSGANWSRTPRTPIQRIRCLTFYQEHVTMMDRPHTLWEVQSKDLTRLKTKWNLHMDHIEENIAAVYHRNVYLLLYHESGR